MRRKKNRKKENKEIKERERKIDINKEFVKERERERTICHGMSQDSSTPGVGWS